MNFSCRTIIKLLMVLSGILILSGCSQVIDDHKETVEVEIETPTPTAGKKINISAWALFPEQQIVGRNINTINEINYVWYKLAGDGQITGANQSPQFVSSLQSSGIKILPAIQNSGFNPKYVTEVIKDEAARSQHVDSIKQLVLDNGYDGIDIDYESLFAEDRENFSQFIEDLSAALHSEKKILSVTVHAKNSDPAGWSGPNAQDWVRIGKSADVVKIMTYDFTSGPGNHGPIAPLDWVDSVLDFAETQISPDKIYVGIPVYGYDYGVSKRKDLTWMGAQSLLNQYSSELHRDENGEAYFQYDLGGEHFVYFVDSKSVEIKVKYIEDTHPEIGGISIWVIGGEDPEIWNVMSGLTNHGQP